MTPKAFDNVTRFQGPSFGPMRCLGARIATLFDPVCGREARL